MIIPDHIYENSRYSYTTSTELLFSHLKCTKTGDVRVNGPPARRVNMKGLPPQAVEPSLRAPTHTSPWMAQDHRRGYGILQWYCTPWLFTCSNCASDSAASHHYHTKKSFFYYSLKSKALYSVISARKILNKLVNDIIRPNLSRSALRVRVYFFSILPSSWSKKISAFPPHVWSRTPVPTTWTPWFCF